MSAAIWMILASTLSLLPSSEEVDVRVRAGAAAVPVGERRLLHGYAFLPPGFVSDPRSEVHLRTRTRRCLPTGRRVLGRYADGSVRVLALCALVPAALAQAGCTLALAPGPGPAPRDRVRVTRSSAGVAVDTGVVRLAVARHGPDLLPELALGRCSCRNGSRPVRLAASVENELFSSEYGCSRGVAIIRDGALESVVEAVGTLADAAGDAQGAFRLRLTCHAGSPLVEVALEVSTLADVGLAEDLCLEIPVDVGRHAWARILGGDGARVACEEGDVAVVALDGHSIHGLAAGQRLPVDPGLRAGLYVRGDRDVGVALAGSRLRPNAPRAVEIRRGGVLRFHLHAGPFLFGDGFMARADLALALSRPRDFNALEPAVTTEPRPGLIGNGHVGRALPGRLPLVDGALGVPVEPLKRLLGVMERAIDRQVGYRDYGDYRLWGGFANLEYDPAAAFLLRHLATGAAPDLVLARDMLNHWVTYDRSRGELGTLAGFPWQHGAEHRSLEYELGHVWAEGLVLGLFVTGERRFGRAALELKDSLVLLSQQEGEFADERSFAWALLALNDLLLIEHDEQVVAAAAAVESRLLKLQHSRGFFRVDRSTSVADAEYAPCPWVTAGITLEALYRQHARCHERRTRAAMARAVAFLLSDARHETGRFARRVHYGPELEGGVARDGTLSPGEQLLVAAGLGRATLLDLAPGVATAFQETLVAACARLPSARFDANQAARALVGLRSLVDTCQHLSGHP